MLPVLYPPFMDGDEDEAGDPDARPDGITSDLTVWETGRQLRRGIRPRPIDAGPGTPAATPPTDHLLAGRMDEVTAALIAVNERLDVLTDAAMSLSDSVAASLTQVADHLETLVAVTAGQSMLVESAAQASPRIEALLEALVELGEKGAGNAEVIDQLAINGRQLDALRRRLAVRARPAPLLDDDAVRSLAKLIAGHLSTES